MTTDKGINNLENNKMAGGITPCTFYYNTDRPFAETPISPEREKRYREEQAVGALLIGSVYFIGFMAIYQFLAGIWSLLHG